MKKGVFGIICVIMITVGFYCYISNNKSTPISIETVPVKTQNLYNSVVVQGTVIGCPRQSIIFSESSNILDVYVSVGQTVKKGDKILLRKRIRSADQSLQALAGKVDSFLSDYGISSTFMPTVSENTALITSDFDGVVTELSAQNNETIPGYTMVAEICESSSCTISAEIPELYISSIRVGQEATVSGAAFDKEEYRGVVTEIASKAQKKINLTGEGSIYFPVEIKLTHTDASLKPGCNATVKIRTAEKKNALVIPYDCITQNDDGKELVCVAKKDGTIETRRIVTGLELEDTTEIVYGLEKGDTVIRNPDIQVHNGGENR